MTTRSSDAHRAVVFMCNHTSLGVGEDYLVVIDPNQSHFSFSLRHCVRVMYRCCLRVDRLSDGSRTHHSLLHLITVHEAAYTLDNGRGLEDMIGDLRTAVQ